MSLLQTSGGKDEPNIVLIEVSSRVKGYLVLNLWIKLPRNNKTDM